MDSMHKNFTFNDKNYSLKCYIDDDNRKRIIIQAKKHMRIGGYNATTTEIYSSTVRKFTFLKFIGLPTERRLEWKVKFAIWKMKKNANKKNSLEDAIKHIDGIYNLDKYMNLEE